MIRYFDTLIQGSDEWKAARCGLLTASEMKFVVSAPPEPETRIKKNGEPYKQREWDPVADNDKCRAHLYELLAQRVTRYVEPSYIGDDMLRGYDDEILARELYSDRYAPIKDVGFVTNDRWGFTIGCSPDGLVEDDGQIESKSRRQKYQMETIVENLLEGTIPQDYVMQVQTALLVTERKWCDLISFCGGLHMIVIRVYPIPEVQKAIVVAASEFEKKLADKMDRYAEALASKARILTTERRETKEMYV